MKKETKISVVMSVYKNDNIIHFNRSIESLLAQSLSPSEIVIVVDGEINEDVNNKINKLAENKLFTIIYIKINKGLANALNLGIKKAKYDFIARMDSDDICFENRLEKQLNYLIDNNLDVVGGQVIEFGENINDIISVRKVPLEHNEIAQFLKTRSPFSHPTVIFRKKVFNQIQGYDVRIFPEDYDFFVRAFLKGFKFGNVKENVLWFRIGIDKQSALKRRHGIRYAKNELKLYKKFYSIGYYNLFDFLKVFFFKIPLRILPFSIFSFLYYNLFRKI